jgi:hypothetical protein
MYYISFFRKIPHYEVEKCSRKMGYITTTMWRTVPLIQECRYMYICRSMYFVYTKLIEYQVAVSEDVDDIFSQTYHETSSMAQSGGKTLVCVPQ